MQVLIRCKVKPDQVERNLELLQAVYEEMRSVRPDGLRYVTFQLEDRVTFVAFAEMDDGPGVLGQLESFQRYRATSMSSAMSLPSWPCCMRWTPTAFADTA